MNVQGTLLPEVLRSAANGSQAMYDELNFWFGYMCGNYFWWWWIILAILIGLLLSVDIRLHNILKHVPKKDMNEYFKPKSKGIISRLKSNRKPSSKPKKRSRK